MSVTNPYYNTFSYSILNRTLEVTSPFGPRMNPVTQVKGFHKGIDLRTGGDIPVYCPMFGRVTHALDQGKIGYGKWIEIDHGNNIKTRYAHLSKQVVTTGEDVGGGYLIGYTGNTGGSTGPHLHFEVRINDIPVDPAPYLFFDYKAISQVTDPTATESDIVDVKTAYEKGKDELGAGIWQIIDLIMDKSIEENYIADISIAGEQGSLLNFVKKICQEPWVEFFGDTYGDKYYFIARRLPMERSTFISLQTTDVTDEEVLSEDLNWTEEGIYSWYQVIPQGYVMDSTYMYRLSQAVFFKEYAEIWGSKPLSIVNNYIQWLNIKDKDDNYLENKCYEFLRFLIDINSYVPFTRKGSITIHGNRAIKIGTRIRYLPTGEIFFVDGVNQSAVFANGVPDRVTTVQLSRGMVEKYVTPEITGKETISYFNLIDYGDRKNKQEFKKKPIVDVPLKKEVVNFDRGSSVFSNGNIFNTIAGNNNCKTLAAKLYTYQSLKIKLNGYSSDDEEDEFDSNGELSENRAKFVKEKILGYYQEIYKPTVANLALVEKRIAIDGGEVETLDLDQKTSIGRLKTRRVEVVQIKDKEKPKDVGKSQSPEKGNWKVNKEVFDFFLKRKQFV